MRSTDDGHTWEQVSDRYGMGTGIPLSNGRLLYVNWTRSDPWNSVRSTFTSKWQNGTMQFSDERVHVELGPSGDEWSIAETFIPGELICMMRQQNHSQYYATARSFDYGRSWTLWRESNVFMGRNPCRPRVHTMPDGRLFFTYGQRDIGRTFAVVSYDKGKTWDIDHRQVILHSPQQYHYFWDSHYTDAAWAEGDLWIAVDYIASSRDQDLRGIYGTFIDTRYFDDVFKGLTLDQIGAPLTGKAVGYWTFDGLDNDFVRDSAHSHYGDIHGAKRVRGRYGTSLDFDGEDHYIMIYDEATLWAQSHFALEAWINTRDAVREQTILSKGGKYRLLLRDGRPVLEVGFGRAPPNWPSRW